MAKPNDKPGPVAAKPPRDLQLLIKPVSGRCNLACEYCFYRRVQESLYPDATVMSGEVLEAMISQLLGLRLTQTSFSWQGGEPTLAGLDFFKEAVRLMMKHGSDGQSVGNAFQTNGILIDDRWSDFLTRYHFLVGISIDGPPEVHNRFRGKTFDKAMRGARTAVKLGVDVNILSCVSSAAEGRAKEVYEFLRGEGFRHLQFIPVVEFTDRPGNITEFSCSPEGYGDFLIEAFDVWRADPEPACIRLFDNLIEFAGTGRSTFCVLAPRCASYVVVEASGDIYPCDFFVRKELGLGNVLDSPDALVRARAMPKADEFARTKLIRPDKCRECEWWRVCRGGCLKEREAAGAFDQPTYLCEGMKRFFNHSWEHFEMLGRRHVAALERARAEAAGEAAGEAHSHAPAGPAGPSARPVEPAKSKTRPNEPCPCGSGRKYKRCCGRR